jgi:FMN phosphatase YigB (HAD superfamily)
MTPPSGAPKGVVWDVGNVIVRWDPRTLYSKIFPDPAERDDFLTRVCTLSWHAATDLGLPAEDNTRLLLDRFPEHEAPIRAWWDRWHEMFSGPIAETEEAMQALADRGVPQFGLTNMAAHTWPKTRTLSVAFRHLADVVISGEEGVIKPEPLIYQRVCERTGMAPGELLFVDDSRANVDGAAALGFHVHHFTDPAALRPTLERLGLL